MTAQILISAYPVSPAHSLWDPELESELLPALCALPGVAGLEVPWTGGIHPHDDTWFLSHLPAVPLAVTPVPFVMRRVGQNPHYGIASTDEDGRLAALSDLRKVATDVKRVERESDASVAVVTLHTAPQVTGRVEPLVRSLREIEEIDWSGARLVIEHCDAYVPNQHYEKGFLSLGAEIAAIEESGTSVGIWLNWGRSAVELRNADAVTNQVAYAAQSGLLVGLTFSGVAPVQSPYGYPWIDAHLPIASTYPESNSLLDEEHVSASILAAGKAPWLGLKVARRPDDRTAAAALRTATRNLEIVRAG